MKLFFQRISHITKINVENPFCLYLKQDDAFKYIVVNCNVKYVEKVKDFNQGTYS